MSYYEVEIDSETIETEVGEYTVRWVVDPDAEEPEDFARGMAYDGRRDYAYDQKIDAVHGDHAGEILELLRECYPSRCRISAAGLARYVRIKYRLQGVLEVTEDYYTCEPGHDLRERVYGLAWDEGSGLQIEAECARVAESGVAEYRAWANGDCFGWQLCDPQGRIVDDCWGYYGYQRERQYTLECATEAAMADAAQRSKQANLVGSGIVGLI